MPGELTFSIRELSLDHAVSFYAPIGSSRQNPNAKRQKEKRKKIRGKEEKNRVANMKAYHEPDKSVS